MQSTHTLEIFGQNIQYGTDNFVFHLCELTTDDLNFFSDALKKLFRGTNKHRSSVVGTALDRR